jgi:hypothetical protein
MTRFPLAAALAATLMLTGCPSPNGGQQPVTQEQQQQNVVTALIAANTALSTASAGLTAAVAAGAIKPGSPKALSINGYLNQASAALDDAHAKLLAGDLVGAQKAIGDANVAAASAKADIPAVSSN